MLHANIEGGSVTSFANFSIRDHARNVSVENTPACLYELQ
jgi:hypothetical protein